MNIYTILRNHAPQKPLLFIEQETLSYGDFSVETERIALALRSLGVTPGDKIGLIMPNSTQWYKVYWAAVKIGAQPVPLDPQIGEWEMARLLNLTECAVCVVATAYRQNPILETLRKIQPTLTFLRHIIVSDAPAKTDYPHPSTLSFDDFLALAAPTADDFVYDPGADDTLMLACTSGSTGNPKIIVVPHRGFHQSQADMAAYLGFGPEDVMLLGMPLYHQGGFGMGLQMALAGGSVCYQPTFEPAKFLSIIAQKRVTVLQLTSTLAKILLAAPEFAQADLASLRLCYFAGEVLPMELARVFFEKLGIRVVNIIGSTETATMVVWDSRDDLPEDSNHFRSLAFTAMRILDEAQREVAEGESGTLFIHTDALLTEYYKNPEETALRLHWLDGRKWFNTGDLGRKLPNGRIQFTGRLKRIIKRGSNLVYPEEIESFLLTHPDIAAVAVQGEKHELMGESIVAYIQPRDGISFTRGDLVKFCRGKLAAYKIPDQVIVTDAIPKDIGKVQFKYLKPGSSQSSVVE